MNGDKIIMQIITDECEWTLYEMDNDWVVC